MMTEKELREYFEGEAMFIAHYIKQKADEGSEDDLAMLDKAKDGALLSQMIEADEDEDIPEHWVYVMLPDSNLVVFITDESIAGKRFKSIDEFDKYCLGIAIVEMTPKAA